MSKAIRNTIRNESRYAPYATKPIAEDGLYVGKKLLSWADRLGDAMNRGGEVVLNPFGFANQEDVADANKELDAKVAQISAETAKASAIAHTALQQTRDAEQNMKRFTAEQLSANHASTLQSVAEHQATWNSQANQYISTVTNTLYGLQAESTQHGQSIQLLHAQIHAQREWISKVNELEHLAQAHNDRLDACDAFRAQLVQLQAQVNANHSKSYSDFDALSALCEELTTQMSQNKQELLAENAALSTMWQEHETKMLADTKARDELYRTALDLNETQRKQNAAILEKTKEDISKRYMIDLASQKADFKDQLKTQQEEYTRQTTHLEQEIKGLRDQYRRTHAEAGALQSLGNLSLKENTRRAPTA